MSYALESRLWSGDLPDDAAAGLKQVTSASANCPECSGMGLAIRWNVPKMIPAPKPAEPPPKRLVRSWPAYCHRCAKGRWLERNHRLHSPDVRRQIRDLADDDMAPLRLFIYSIHPDSREDWIELEKRPGPPPPIREWIADLVRRTDAKRLREEEAREQERRALEAFKAIDENRKKGATAEELLPCPAAAEAHELAPRPQDRPSPYGAAPRAAGPPQAGADSRRPNTRADNPVTDPRPLPHNRPPAIPHGSRPGATLGRNHNGKPATYPARRRYREDVNQC